jgi:hypothetical protein
MVQASFQLRQPLFDRKRRGIGGEGRKRAQQTAALITEIRISILIYSRGRTVQGALDGVFFS